MRRVRVALFIGEGVVTTMRGDPIDDGTLHRHRACDRKNDLQWATGDEALVREEAMVADRDAEPGEVIEEDGDARIEDAETGTPEINHRERESGEGEHGQDQDDDALDLLLTRGHRLYAGYR